VAAAIGSTEPAAAAKTAAPVSAKPVPNEAQSGMGPEAAGRSFDSGNRPARNVLIHFGTTVGLMLVAPGAGG
jgi:hypothetical protein